MKKSTLVLGIALCCMAFISQAQFKINQKTIDAAAKTAKAATVSDAEVIGYAKEYIDWMDKNNPVCKNDKYSKRLEKLSAGLENHDGLKLNFKAYKVVDVNAFACADGSIRVFAGLMDIMTDEEILGVIGHEIGHVKNNDIKDAFRTALLTSALRDAAASQGGAAATLSDSQLGSLGEALTNAQFSQKQEKKADEYGYNFLKGCGKNPWAMSLAFERLNQLEKEYGADKSGKMDRLMSTHPDTEKRAKTMAEKATKDGFARPENKMPVEENAQPAAQKSNKSTKKK